MRPLLIVVLISLLLPSAVEGRQYSFRHLSTEEGLLSDYRLSMAEDKHGRLWISSDEGLNVYDGKEMISYSVPGNSGLINNRITEIFCDKEGTIWLATPSGVQYRRESDPVFRKLDAGADKMNALFFESAPGGGVLIATPDECYLVDKKFKASKLGGFSALFKNNTGPYVFYHLKGNLYMLGFGKMLVLADVANQKIVREYNYRQAWCIAGMTDSTVMAGCFTRDTIAIINLNSGNIECINGWATSDNERIAGYAGTIQAIGDNKYAVGCRLYGVYIIDAGRHTADHLTHDPGDAHSLASQYCRKLFVSSKGILFAHTRGLSYTSVKDQQFGIIKSMTNSKGERYDGGFNAFAEDEQGNLWIGTNSFLAYYPRTTGKAAYYPYYDPKAGPQKFKTIRTVVRDAKGRVWIGSFGGGMGMLQKDHTWKRYVPNKEDRDHSIPSTEISSIVKNRANRFIICTNAGFAIFDPITDSFTTFFKHPVLKSIGRNNTFYAFEDNTGRLWLGQSQGLFCYDPNKNLLTKIPLPAAWSASEMLAICQDRKGTIYAGGFDGLILVNPATFTIEKILGKKDGLTGNSIIGLHADRNNNIWILGNRGLARYHPATGVLQAFHPHDGLEQTNHGLCNLYETRSGEILIGSFSGFNYFYPENIKPIKYALDVFVSSAELNDTLITMPLTGGPLRLKAHDNNITFTYLAADFSPGSAVRYRYKLTGFDTAYVNAGLQRKAKYTNLPAGNYTFTVEASTNGYDWYSAPEKISFSIARVFYKTWWFRGLIIILLLGGTYYLFRRRVWYIRQKAARESEHEIKLNELENSSLRTQMNPHFIFNSLNTINAFINSNEKAQANQYISKFSKLIRLILDHSRQRTVSLSEELEALNVYVQMEQIRFDKKFDFDLEVSSDINVYDTEIPSLIFQPFVENAILHGLLPLGKPGLLRLCISRKGETLFCVVEDNGIGRVKAREERSHRPQNKKSHGLDITLKRMDLFNKENGLGAGTTVIDLYDADGHAAGTRVEITLALTERF